MRRLISSHSLTHSIFSSLTYVFLMARYLKIVIFKSIQVFTTHAEIDTKRLSTHVPLRTRSGARAFPSLPPSTTPTRLRRSALLAASRPNYTGNIPPFLTSCTQILRVLIQIQIFLYPYNIISLPLLHYDKQIR